MGEPDSRAKYRELPPNVGNDDMVIEVETKQTGVEPAGLRDHEGDDPPPRLVVW